MGNRITRKGQVTIPKSVRDELGLRPGDEVEFVKDDGSYSIRRRVDRDPFEKWYGYLKDKVGGKTTDELIREMRGE
jgi:AbrB family looped-hinge helix DNA binding protein